MSEPVFTVPLAALVRINQIAHSWHWRCEVENGWRKSDGCHPLRRAASESAARAAAVAHLEQVHGIRAVTAVT